MPEKPEVLTVVKNLKSRIINKCITDVKIYYPKVIEYPSVDEFKQRIIKQKIINVYSRGKFIIIELDRDCLLVHLRMEGKFFFRNKNDEVNKHEHVTFVLNNDEELRFHDTRKFGRVYLINKDRLYSERPLNSLGLEYNDLGLDTTYLQRKFKNKRLPIKSVLLDQSIITGIGNIYADEILFYSAINPLEQAMKLSILDCENLIKNLFIIFNKAIDLGGTTIKSYTSSEGVHGNFQNELAVHTKNICPKCGNKIMKIRVNGRGTYYCGSCQKLK